MIDLLKNLPPASQNNSREIIGNLLKKFNKQPSEFLAQQIEALSGLTYDFSENDWGNGQRGN